MAVHPDKLAFAGKQHKLATAGKQHKVKVKPLQPNITLVTRFNNHEPYILTTIIAFWPFICKPNLTYDLTRCNQSKPTEIKLTQRLPVYPVVVG